MIDDADNYLNRLSWFHLPGVGVSVAVGVENIEFGKAVAFRELGYNIARIKCNTNINAERGFNTRFNLIAFV